MGILMRKYMSLLKFDPEFSVCLCLQFKILVIIEKKPPPPTRKKKKKALITDRMQLPGLK